MARRYKAISDRISAEDEAKKRLAGQIASWITAQNATKVRHDLGMPVHSRNPNRSPRSRSSTRRKPGTSLMDSFRPDAGHHFDELWHWRKEIQIRCTVTVKPEPQNPRLHPYWK